jgi:hypothetical protein
MGPIKETHPALALDLGMMLELTAENERAHCIYQLWAIDDKSA